MIPAMKVCVSTWTDCGLTENWNWFPVVERMVIAPNSERETVPLVYVVSEFAIPEIPVCAPPTFAPGDSHRVPILGNGDVVTPARVRVPDEMSACAPDVFPESVTATIFWVCTVWATGAARRCPPSGLYWS